MASLETIRRLQLIATTQGFADAVAKLEGIAEAQKDVAVTSTATTSAQQGMENQFRRMLNAADPLERSLSRLEKTERDLARFAAAGVGTAEQRAKVLVNAQQQAIATARGNDQLANSHRRLGQDVKGTTNLFGLQGYQVRNLTAQFVDLGVQIGSGGGLFRPLLQQGPQAVDAMGGVAKAIETTRTAWNSLSRTTRGGIIAGGVLGGIALASKAALDLSEHFAKLADEDQFEISTNKKRKAALEMKVAFAEWIGTGQQVIDVNNSLAASYQAVTGWINKQVTAQRELNAVMHTLPDIAAGGARGIDLNSPLGLVPGVGAVSHPGGPPAGSKVEAVKKETDELTRLDAIHKALLESIAAVTVAEKAAAAASMVRAKAVGEEVLATTEKKMAEQAAEAVTAQNTASTKEAIRQLSIRRNLIKAEGDALSLASGERERYLDQARAIAQLQSEGKSTVDALAKAFIAQSVAVGQATRTLADYQAAQQRSIDNFHQLEQLQLQRSQDQTPEGTSASEAAAMAAMQERQRLTREGINLSEEMRERLIAEAAAVAGLAQQIENENTARAMLQGQADQLALLEAETRAIGMNEEERAVLMARMQAEIEARQLVEAGLASEAAAYIRNAEAIARATAERNRAVASARSSGGGGASGQVASDFSSTIDTGGGPGVATMPSRTYRAPPGAVVRWSYHADRSLSIWFQESMANFAKRMAEAAEAARQIKQHMEDAAQARVATSMSLQSSLLDRQIQRLEEQRSRLEQGASRGSPYLDPYSFKNASRFYNPGAGGHFGENEAMTAGESAQVAALDAQIAQLHAQADKLDRLAMLQGAGVELSKSELAELKSINQAIRAGATQQEYSDFKRMMEAYDRQQSEALAAAIASARAGMTTFIPTGAVSQSSSYGGGGQPWSISPQGYAPGGGMSGAGTSYSSSSGFAKGGEAMVPGSHRTDRPYGLIGLTGGERITVRPANDTAPRSDRAVNMTVNITLPPWMRERDVKRSAGESAREMRRQARRLAGR